MSPKTRWLPTL